MIRTFQKFRKQEITRFNLQLRFTTKKTMHHQDSNENSQFYSQLILLDDSAAEKALGNKADLYAELSQGPPMMKKESIKYDYGIDNSNFDPSPFKMQIQEIAEVESVNKSQKSIKCNCSKTKCQKNYCECFRARKVCGEQCSCIGCCNNEPETFNFKRTTSGPTCRCRRSNCLKNYCQCHNVGKSCSEQCKCFDCLNTQDKNQQLEINKKSKRRIKKIRKNPPPPLTNISHNDL